MRSLKLQAKRLLYTLGVVVCCAGLVFIHTHVRKVAAQNPYVIGGLVQASDTGVGVSGASFVIGLRDGETAQTTEYTATSDGSGFFSVTVSAGVGDSYYVRPQAAAPAGFKNPAKTSNDTYSVAANLKSNTPLNSSSYEQQVVNERGCAETVGWSAGACNFIYDREPAQAPPANGSGVGNPPPNNGGVGNPPPNNGGVGNPPPNNGGVGNPPPNNGGGIGNPIPQEPAPPSGGGTSTVPASSSLKEFKVYVNDCTNGFSAAATYDPPSDYYHNMERVTGVEQAGLGRGTLLGQSRVTNGATFSDPHASWEAQGGPIQFYIYTVVENANPTTDYIIHGLSDSGSLVSVVAGEAPPLPFVLNCSNQSPPPNPGEQQPPVPSPEESTDDPSCGAAGQACCATDRCDNEALECKLI